MIGGTMGVGKTETCNQLKHKLHNAVFLDGDWCWNADPFQVTDETKKMVLDNISYLLNKFIHCTAYQNIIFCWVMHEQSIIDSILSRIETKNCYVKQISLVCNAEELTKRLQSDIDAELRNTEIISRSIKKLPLYNALHTIKIDTTNMTVAEVTDKIITI